MEGPSQVASKPFRPPPLPLGSRLPAGGGLPKGPGRPIKPKGLPSALDLASKKDEGGCSQVFSMATPRGESTVERHYMGTPRASSILSAFLDFDDTDVGGPPLDPEDYCAVGIQGSAPPLDFDDDDLAALVERHSAAKKQEGDDSVSSGSTRSAETEDGDASSSPGDDDESPAKVTVAKPTFALDDGDHDEEYEEDFEEESDSDEDQDA